MNDENFISLYFVVIIEPLIVGKLIKCHIPNLLNLQTMPAAPPRPLEGSDDAMSVRFRMYLTPMTIRDTRVQRCNVMSEYSNWKV